jgi:hypothetical protein
MRALAWCFPLTVGLLSVSAPALAAPFLDLSGRVALLDGVVPDGVRVRLGLDLDRDGTLNSFEVVEARVSADGSYAVTYTPETDPLKIDTKFAVFVLDLVADYEARGFEALLDDGPLPVIVRFEREGYSTIVKRFTTLTDLPSLDVVLAPLSPVACSAGDCMAPDGTVHVSGFPGGTGIARAYARRYDPLLDQAKFPGAFTDSADNLLISSGFTEVDLRDATGAHVSRLSAPVSVRFQTDATSWASLRDLTPDSSRIEVPMYSFDEARGDWVSEAAGELQAADGTAIDEADFASIQDGSYPAPVFVAFATSHFSTFNCDAPNRQRACVQGRLVTLEGEAVVGAPVSLQGVTYTGTAGTVYTGNDGYFASDLMKSEVSGEDADGNGKKGETFQARVSVNGAIGVFTGEPFDTPTTQGSIGRAKSCRPPSCDCLDLGDVTGDFELPRACEITVNVTYSGKGSSGSKGPFAKGDAIVNASVTGEISGGLSLPGDAALCGGAPCGGGTVDADGNTTFVVPLVGDAPSIQVRAQYSVTSGGDTHYYTGSARVTGCGRAVSSLEGSIDLLADHATLDDLGDYIATLGGGPTPPNPGSTLGDDLGFRQPAAPSCACRQAPASSTVTSGWSLAAAALGLAALTSRRRRLLPLRIPLRGKPGRASRTSTPAADRSRAR